VSLFNFLKKIFTTAGRTVEEVQTTIDNLLFWDLSDEHQITGQG
jgi:hypothetical protein